MIMILLTSKSLSSGYEHSFSRNHRGVGVNETRDEESKIERFGRNYSFRDPDGHEKSENNHHSPLRNQIKNFPDVRQMEHHFAFHAPVFVEAHLVSLLINQNQGLLQLRDKQLTMRGDERRRLGVTLAHPVLVLAVGRRPVVRRERLIPSQFQMEMRVECLVRILPDGRNQLSLLHL